MAFRLFASTSLFKSTPTVGSPPRDLRDAVAHEPQSHNADGRDLFIRVALALLAFSCSLMKRSSSVERLPSRVFSIPAKLRAARRRGALQQRACEEHCYGSGLLTVLVYERRDLCTEVLCERAQPYAALSLGARVEDNIG